MFRFFAKAANLPQPSVQETQTLQTRHGPVTVNRMVLHSGDVAYICHTAAKVEDAALSVRRLEIETIDRNTSEAHCADNMLSEDGSAGKSDYAHAAERACNDYRTMNKAVVVVFFDHLRSGESGGFKEVVQEIRSRYPATRPELDVMDFPPVVANPATKAAARMPECRPAPPSDFHYSC